MNIRSGGPAVPAVLVWMLAVAALASAPASANIPPPTFVLFNVRGYDGSPCPTQIQECEQCQQWTEAVGDVEFDVFLVDQGLHSRVRTIVLDVRYPDGWADYCWWPGFEICNGSGQAACEWTAEGTRFTIQYDPELPVYGVTLIGRFYCYVSNYGNLEVSANIDGDTQVAVSHAEAGVVCNYGFTECGWRWPEACYLAFDTEILSLAAPVGGSDRGVVHATRHVHEGVCPVAFEDDADWLTLDVEQVSQSTYDVKATADADGMAPGIYETWLRGEARARRCVLVAFEVLESSSVPPGEGPPVRRAVTLGRIRTLYR